MAFPVALDIACAIRMRRATLEHKIGRRAR
jgi:hypothetical protein